MDPRGRSDKQARVLHVDCEREGEVTVLALSGEADLGTVKALGDVVEPATASGRVVVVDCAGLTFIDCTTLGVLLEGQNRAARYGGDLVLRNCHGIVAQVLDALQLGGRLTRPARPAAPIRPALPAPLTRPAPPAPAGDRDRPVMVTPAMRPRSTLW